MSAILLCVLAFVATFWAAKRSLGRGLVAVAVVGYAYGILRANFLDPASHFIFDASLTGLYLAYGSRFFVEKNEGQNSALRVWTALLIAWPCLVCLLPFQPLMVSLVGLRGNIFFLPVLLIGSRLKNEDLREFIFGVAVLNLVALGFGIAEYFRGIEPYFPRSEVTAIMYASGDVAGGHFRIPSIFTSAHAYAGTMVCTIPYLFGAWSQPTGKSHTKLIFLLGMVAAFAGVLLSSTRVNFVNAAYLTLVVTLTTKLSFRKRLLWGLAIAAIAVLTLTNERFQRFKTLDSSFVVERVGGSVNRNFLEILFEHPMGNGLGGGGTSTPYFLQGLVRNPIGIENEYGRILAEQGVIGLLLWISFIGWCAVRRTPFRPHAWLATRRLLWFGYMFYFLTAAIGIGMLTAIPQTFFLLLSIGWTTVVPVEERSVRPYAAAVQRNRIPAQVAAWRGHRFAAGGWQSGKTSC